MPVQGTQAWVAIPCHLLKLGGLLLGLLCGLLVGLLEDLVQSHDGRLGEQLARLWVTELRTGADGIQVRSFGPKDQVSPNTDIGTDQPKGRGRYGDCFCIIWTLPMASAR